MWAPETKNEIQNRIKIAADIPANVCGSGVYRSIDLDYLAISLIAGNIFMTFMCFV